MGNAQYRGIYAYNDAEAPDGVTKKQSALYRGIYGYDETKLEGGDDDVFDENGVKLAPPELGTEVIDTSDFGPVVDSGTETSYSAGDKSAADREAAEPPSEPVEGGSTDEPEEEPGEPVTPTDEENA